MKPNRFAVLALSLLGVVASRADTFSEVTNAMAGVVNIPEHRVSIIYIQCHGLGYGDLSCYGQTNYQTPNLDRLAAEGMRFTNFRPAGADFDTALSGLVTGRAKPGANPLTVAQRLKDSGYHTGLIGEWSRPEKPWTCGFDEFGGFLSQDAARNYYPDTIWRFDPLNTYDEATHQWVDLKPGDTTHNGGPEMLYGNTAGKHEQYLPELLAKMVSNFVHNNAPDQFNQYRPFFLLVNLPDPRSARAGADEFPVPSDAPYSDEKWPQAAKNRVSLLTRLDGGISQLLEQLKHERITNNVAIFFSSSEAPEKFADKKLDFLAPNGKAMADKDGIAPLPMIVWWPGAVAPGSVSPFKWTGLDFMPTVLQTAFVKPVKDLDGMTILPVLEGKHGPDVDVPGSPGPMMNPGRPFSP